MRHIVDGAVLLRIRGEATLKNPVEEGRRRPTVRGRWVCHSWLRFGIHKSGETLCFLSLRFTTRKIRLMPSVPWGRAEERKGGECRWAKKEGEVCYIHGSCYIRVDWTYGGDYSKARS